MITDNIDVDHSIANGLMCKFVGVELKQDMRPFTIYINGYYVNCVEGKNISVAFLHTAWNSLNRKSCFLCANSLGVKTSYILCSSS